MHPSDLETRLLQGFSHYVVGGRLRDSVTVRELVTASGLSEAETSAAISRLLGRGWATVSNPLHWTSSDTVVLQGEGLARAAAIAARRELTLHEVQIGEDCFFVAYEEPGPGGRTLWTARAFLAGHQEGKSVAEASGPTRTSARDLLALELRKRAGESTTASAIEPCDEGNKGAL